MAEDGGFTSVLQVKVNDVPSSVMKLPVVVTIVLVGFADKNVMEQM